MRKNIFKRLDALGRQCRLHQEAAERRAFFNFAPIVLLSYFVGDLKPKENCLDGYARALDYRGWDDLAEALAHALEVGNASKLRNREQHATRRLFAQFRYDRSSQDALEEAIIKMEKRLPEEWRELITDVVEQVDYYKEKVEEERMWRKIEAMAAHEAGLRRKQRKVT